MSLAASEVERTYQNYKKDGVLRKDDAFALLYLEQHFGLNPEHSAKQVALGGNNYGVDAFHFDPRKRNLYLFEFRWSEDYAGFKDAIQALARVGIDAIFGGMPYNFGPDAFLSKLKSIVAENRSIIDQIFIQFIFNGDPAEAEQSETLSSLFEELEGKKYVIDEFFGRRRVNLVFEFRSNKSELVGGVVHSVKTHKYRLDFSRSISSETPHGEKLQVGFMKLMDLYEIYREMGPRFFERNIRAGLSAERPTNKSIRKSLEQLVSGNGGDPESFVFLHNGVTLAAEDFEIKKGAAYVTEPRLLNGAQTVTTLARFIEDNEGDRKFEENLHMLDRIQVIGKIVSSADHEFVSRVTICNNRQNPVEPWNLRANDPIQLEYQERFRRTLGLYYERQEGAFASLSDEDLGDLGMDSQKALEMKRLAQTILAMQGEIDKMSRLRYVFENDSTYKSTFRESYLRNDPKRILLAYKVQFRTNMVARDFMERWPNKYHFMGRARNLLWALLIQALYNDEKLDSIMEQFAGSLTIETEFAETLKDLASKRVRFLISDLAEEPRHQEMCAVANFSFLRTKASYTRCMQYAADRFGWKKHSF